VSEEIIGLVNTLLRNSITMADIARGKNGQCNGLYGQFAEFKPQIRALPNKPWWTDGDDDPVNNPC
jgi:hypothetical protein